MTPTPKPRPPLPDGILASDLKFAGYADQKDVPYDDREFELWHAARFGWCIPTLLIGRAGRSGQSTDRTYAVTLHGDPVRIGKGPHVTATVTVYVTTKRLPALQRFLDLRREGAGKAGVIRDRISSRRAQGQLERADGNRSWRWKV